MGEANGDTIGSMTRLHVSILFSATDKYLSLLVTIAMTAIVARLLSPEEIGVFVVANAVLVLSETLRDFGTGTYIIQERVPSREGVRTAFTVMAAIGGTVSLALFSAAPLFAEFYAEPRLVTALRIASLGILASSFAAVSMSVLRRDMDFRALAFINVGGIIVNLLVAVGLALAGWSYLALVIGGVAGQFFVAIAALICRPNFWMFVPCLSKWREVLAFGGWSSMTTLLNNLYALLPQLLLGRTAGFDAAALYNRATILCQLPDRAVIGAVQPMLLPALTARARMGADLKSAYLYALSLLSAVHWPLLLGLAMLAEPAVRIMLGPQWDAAAPLLRIMALAWLTTAAASLTFPVLVAVGRVRDTLIASLISLPPSALVLVLAAPHGMTAVAASMLVALPLQTVVAMVTIRRHVGFAWTEVASAVWKSAVAASASAVVPLAIASHNGFRADLSFVLLAMAIAGAGAGWLAALAVTRHPLLAEIRTASGFVTRFGPSSAPSRVRP